jgi:RNA recognition motif-containing protein
MTALSEDLAPQETAQSAIKPNPQAQNKESERERTLFCINIDQNCSEDILYELFLQVTRQAFVQPSV